MRYTAKILGILSILLVVGCIKEETQSGGNQGPTAMVKPGFVYFTWLSNALGVDPTLDSNPLDGTDNNSGFANFVNARDRLPGSTKLAGLTSGAHLTTFSLAARICNRFITDDLNRPDGTRRVFNSFGFVGNGNNRTFAATNEMRDDMKFILMVHGFHKLLFGDSAAPDSIVADAISGRASLLNGIAAPTSQNNRELAISICAGLASSPRAIAY